MPLDAIYRSSPYLDLSIQDQVLVRELVDGVLRSRERIDFYISNLSDRQLTRIDQIILWILRVSLYEMESLRIPHYASVHTAVSLCKSVGKTSAKGFVNAVLRGFQRNPPQLPAGNSARALAVRYSHPRWLVGRYLDRWGIQTSIEMLERNNQLPEPTLWVNPSRIEMTEFCETLVADGFQVEVVAEVPNCARVSGRGLTDHVLYREGYCFFMDLSSQRVVSLVDLAGKGVVADFCAAPGGKSFLIASQLDTHALLVSSDVSRRRLAFMKKRSVLYRLESPNLVQGDLESGPPFGGSFDFVLADVPCSGLGTIRSNPDLRWTRRESDLARYQKKQLRILAGSFAALKRGRCLVYSTCSTEPEENEQVVEEFLAVQNEAKLVGEFFRTFPENQGGDGFFAAQVRRV
jgi:16S rRNA (cytosine967-C5)-methyltransferase